jgi:hypothetical protein
MAGYYYVHTCNTLNSKDVVFYKIGNMSAIPASQTIVFAINSAVKMSRNIQRAYAKSLREKNIVLPLPDFDTKPNETDIQDFFDHPSRKAYVTDIERLAFLHQQAHQGRLEPPLLHEYRDYYYHYRGFTEAELSGALVQEDFITLLRIRQWERGLGGPGDRPTALRLVAGTVVEIGIDYFQNFPGALNVDSAHGMAIHHFLDALDQISFSEGNIKFAKILSRRVVPRLFAAAAETIRDLSPQFSNDPKLQQFIRKASHKIATDIYDRVGPDTLDSEREKTVHWGQLVLSSVIRHAGTTFFTQSSELLGASDAEAQLIESTGLALLNLIIDEKEDTLHFHRALTGEGLDKVVRASMGVIAQHPELISKKQGLRNIIAGVSQSIHMSGINRPGLAPELVRLILEQTAGNLHLLWSADSDQPEHLLLITVRELLQALSQKGPGDKWTPSLTRDQLLDLAYLLTDEVVNNPAWITQQVGENTLMGYVLRSVMHSLQQIPAEQRFHSEILEEVLQVSLQAVVLSPQLVEKLDEQGTTILSKSLDLIFTAIFPDGEKPSPAIERAGLLDDLLSYAFDVILARHPDKRGLILIRLIVFEEAGFDFKRGFDAEWVERLVDAAATVLSEFPELAAQEEGLQRLVGRIAKAVRDSTFDQPELLPEMIRLVLVRTAGELDLLVPTAQGQFRHLLIEALEQLLLALSQKEDGRWQPRLTVNQIIDISEFILQKVTDNPGLAVGEQSLIWGTLDAVLQSLRQVEKQRPVSYGLFKIFFQHAMVIVQREHAFLEKVSEGAGGAPPRIRLTEALIAFVGVLFDETLDERARWNLSQTNVLESILELYLLQAAEGSATTNVIEELRNALQNAVRHYAERTTDTVEELLQEFQKSVV